MTAALKCRAVFVIKPKEDIAKGHAVMRGPLLFMNLLRKKRRLRAILRQETVITVTPAGHTATGKLVGIRNRSDLA